MSASATPALPGMLRDNPRLDQWVRFTMPGHVTVSTGRVEIGQGVLTAMRQIAAEELDVSPDRILLQTGDTELTPNEGYTAGSQSIQFGGVALRLACAEVRGLFLDHAASQSGHARAELSVDDGAILHRGQPTGQDYWALAAAVDLARDATGSAAAAVARDDVTGDNVGPLNPFGEGAGWRRQPPSTDKPSGAPPADPAPAARSYEATYTRMHIAHASIGPSCGLAVYRDGHLQVWTHCQGVYPLRAALARTLKLDPAAISVKHVQGRAATAITAPPKRRPMPQSSRS